MVIAHSSWDFPCSPQGTWVPATRPWKQDPGCQAAVGRQGLVVQDEASVGLHIRQGHGLPTPPGPTISGWRRVVGLPQLLWGSGGQGCVCQRGHPPPQLFEGMPMGCSLSTRPETVTKNMAYEDGLGAVLAIYSWSPEAPWPPAW